MLASNNMFTGESSLNFYERAQESKPEIIDLHISNLPENIAADNLKKISGSKHVINATIDFDNLKGTCRGSGRVQLRLNNGETADQVKLNFLRLGYQVSEHDTDSKRKCTITGTPQ